MTKGAGDVCHMLDVSHFKSADDDSAREETLRYTVLIITVIPASIILTIVITRKAVRQRGFASPLAASALAALCGTVVWQLWRRKITVIHNIAWAAIYGGLQDWFMWSLIMVSVEECLFVGSSKLHRQFPAFKVGLIVASTTPLLAALSWIGLTYGLPIAGSNTTSLCATNCTQHPIPLCVSNGEQHAGSSSILAISSLHLFVSLLLLLSIITLQILVRLVDPIKDIRRRATALLLMQISHIFLSCPHWILILLSETIHPKALGDEQRAATALAWCQLYSPGLVMVILIIFCPDLMDSFVCRSVSRKGQKENAPENLNNDIPTGTHKREAGDESNHSDKLPIDYLNIVLSDIKQDDNTAHV